MSQAAHKAILELLEKEGVTDTVVAGSAIGAQVKSPQQAVTLRDKVLAILEKHGLEDPYASSMGTFRLNGEGKDGASCVMIDALAMSVHLVTKEGRKQYAPLLESASGRPVPAALAKFLKD
jgi:hypothetical protein